MDNVFVNNEWETQYWKLKTKIRSWTALMLVGFVETITLFAFWVIDGQTITWGVFYILMAGLITLMIVYYRHTLKRQLQDHLSAQLSPKGKST